MRRCEKEGAGHGFTELGFAVGVENAGARIFYARNGYSELERSRFTLRYAYVDARGNNREAEETCTNWIKALA